MGDSEDVGDGFDNERCFNIDFKPVDVCCWRIGEEIAPGERCRFELVLVGVVESSDDDIGESLLGVGVVGVVGIELTANGGGIDLRLNFADGPRRSRILAEDVLGEFIGESENGDADEILDAGGLKRFTDVVRFGNEGDDDDDGGNDVDVVVGGWGIGNDGIRLFVDGVLSVDVADEVFRLSDGEISDAGTGGGGGWSVPANGLII